MKCIYCGETIKETFTKCPKCGKPTQIVPDYSIYDDDNIHVLLEGTQQISDVKEATSNEKTQNIKQELQKQEAQKKKIEEARKQQNKRWLKLVSVSCILLIVIGILVKISIDTTNRNSLEYQYQKGTTALMERNYEEALVFLEQANKIAPQNCDVLFSLSEVYLKLEKESQGIDCLKQIVELDTSHTGAYDALISYYEKRNDTQSVLELMKTTENAQVLLLFHNYIVEVPSISKKEGTYNDYLRLTLSSKMNTTIYYTLDGSNPIQNGILYRGQIFLDEMGEFTLKAVAKNRKGIYSDILTQNYVINIAPPSYPTISPGSGTYTEETYISVYIPNGCSAYYTWDNTNPTENSTLYVGPILIPEGRNQVLSVILIDNNTGLVSPVSRSSYDYVPEVEDIEGN